MTTYSFIASGLFGEEDSSESIVSMSPVQTTISGAISSELVDELVSAEWPPTGVLALFMGGCLPELEGLDRFWRDELDSLTSLVGPFAKLLLVLCPGRDRELLPISFKGQQLDD